MSCGVICITKFSRPTFTKTWRHYRLWKTLKALSRAQPKTIPHTNLNNVFTCLNWHTKTYTLAIYFDLNNDLKIDCEVLWAWLLLGTFWGSWGQCCHPEWRKTSPHEHKGSAPLPWGKQPPPWNRLYVCEYYPWVIIKRMEKKTKPRDMHMKGAAFVGLSMWVSKRGLRQIWIIIDLSCFFFYCYDDDRTGQL